MGLIKCPDCGNMVSERAAACPSCGCPADAFSNSSTEMPDTIEVVKKIEIKPNTNSIIDDRFRRSDGTLDDTHNVFSPNYRKNNNSNNVFSPNYKKAAETDHDDQIGSFIAYSMFKAIDRQDLMLANETIIKYLQGNLSINRPITYFSLENCSIAGKVHNHEFTFPYIIVTANFRYYLDYRRFTLTRADGRSYSRYFDQKTLPSEYAPKIEVISDNESEVLEIIDKIKGLFKEPKSFYVPFLGGNDESLSFSCEIESVEKTGDIYSGGKTIFLHKTVVFKRSPWASYIDDEANPTKNESMRFFRKVQYTQFCLLYSQMKDNCDSQLTLYERLYLYVSMFRGAFGPAQTDEYKILRNRVQAGQPFDADLIDKAFPTISLIYHELPNDINNKTPVSKVKEMVYEKLDQYKAKWEKACVEINLPNDFDMYGKIVCCRDNDGLSFILECLDKNVTRSMDDILEEIKARVTSMYMEEQRQAQNSYYEPEPQYSGSGTSILGSVLQTAAGVALGNKMSENNKQNYFGSSNCERAKTGAITSCWGCHMGEYCTMYHKGKTIL